MFAALSFILCFVWQYWAGFWARYAPASILANPTEDDHHEDSSGQDTLGEYAQREEDLAAGDEHERDGRPLNRYPEALEDDLSSRTFRYRFGIQYRRIVSSNPSYMVCNLIVDFNSPQSELQTTPPVRRLDFP